MVVATKLTRERIAPLLLQLGRVAPYAGDVSGEAPPAPPAPTAAPAARAEHEARHAALCAQQPRYAEFGQR